MAVHGRYGKPCPDCGEPVQRVVYAANEANYCARCQTGGRLLAIGRCRGCSAKTGQDAGGTGEKAEEVVPGPGSRFRVRVQGSGSRTRTAKI